MILLPGSTVAPPTSTMSDTRKLADVVHVNMFPLTGKNVSVTMTYRQIHDHYAYVSSRSRKELEVMYQKIFKRYVFHPVIDQLLPRKFQGGTQQQNRLVSEWSCYCVLAYCARYELYGTRIPTMKLPLETFMIEPKLFLHAPE